MTSDETNGEESFDLSGVLKNRMLDLRVNYVLIIEWLFEGDEKTGLALANWLLCRLPVSKVEHFRCRSPADMEVRLDQARRETSTRGTPIVHIEAHGESPIRGQAPRGFIGPDSKGGRELLEWERLGDMLRPLNIASRFNLLVVGAACYGEGLVLAAQGGKPMPFVAVVGYTGTVSPMSLRHSLQELYRGLLLENAELGLAVEAADDQHHFPTDAVLRPTKMVVLLAESFITGTALNVRKLRNSGSTGSMGASGTPLKSGLPSLPPKELQIFRQSLAEAWSLMWMLEDFPENADRFAIDADRLIELAIEYADRS